jgi:hypothetical protein
MVFHSLGIGLVSITKGQRGNDGGAVNVGQETATNVEMRLKTSTTCQVWRLLSLLIVNQ